MELIETNIEGCFLVRPRIFRDHRGIFFESYQKARFEEALGRPVDFVQDNLSVSGKHVLRGLHYQKSPWGQAKLVTVLRGRVRDVVVDLREESPTYLQQLIVELNGSDIRMLYIPKGLAHGFLSLEDDTVFQYKCDAYYRPEAEAGIRFDDPDLAIDWGIPGESIQLSDKDSGLPYLKSN